jgi:hypothetical protein
MNKLIMEIKEIQEKINNLIKDKLEFVENKRTKMDNDVLDCELSELETQLNLSITKYNNYLQLQHYQSMCNHVFIEDLIDLTPDKSKTIEYCAHCFLEK